MPAGLRVWDASGNLTVDLTTRLSRVAGTIAMTVGGGSATLNVPAGQSVWYMTLGGGQAYVPNFTVAYSGTTITITWSNNLNYPGYPGSATTVIMVIGVY